MFLDTIVVSDEAESSSSPLTENTSSASMTTAHDLPDTSASSLPVASNTSIVSGSAGGFPVDWVVYVRVQPSLVRFTCLPVSRVECLLRLPSFDVTFSTKKSDPCIEAGAAGVDGTPPTKAKSELRHF